jgi:hypothetical protein
MRPGLATLDLSSHEPSWAPRPSFVQRRVRAVPIRWRILGIAILNSGLGLILLFLIFDGAKELSAAWGELRQARESERFLLSLDSEAGRLQSLIHRYFNQPSPGVLAEIIRRRETLTTRLRAEATLDPVVAEPAGALIEITERFIRGFDDLRAVRAAISQTYDAEVLRPARDMAGLYAIIDSTAERSDSLIRPALGKSREAFNATLLAANAYYLSLAPSAGEDARRHMETIERTAPVMVDLAEGDLQRSALLALRERAAALRRGLDQLSAQFASQGRLLRDSIDEAASAMGSVTDRLNDAMREREGVAQAGFDRSLSQVGAEVAAVALAFIAFVVLIGTGVSRGISDSLAALGGDMRAIVSGDLRPPGPGRGGAGRDRRDGPRRRGRSAPTPSLSGSRRRAPQGQGAGRKRRCPKLRGHPDRA